MAGGHWEKYGVCSEVSVIYGLMTYIQLSSLYGPSVRAWLLVVVLVIFCQFFCTQQEQISTEELVPQDWPVGIGVGVHS